MKVLGEDLNLADRNLLFRVDASRLMGSGHFYRCLTLAEACLARGAKISFISRKLPEAYRKMLVERKIELLDLCRIRSNHLIGDLAHSSWLEVNQIEDAEECLYLIGESQNDWLVVDHYALDYRWERLLRKVTKKIFVIDDLADRRHECDILLDQNFYFDSSIRYVDKLNSDVKKLLGPEYALLRQEFSDQRSKLKRMTENVSRVLISFGGVDKNNHTNLTIDALVDLEIDGIEVDVVVGAGNNNHESISKKCVIYGFNYFYQHDLISELMVKADLCIGAGGISIWERCCLGLPSIAIPGEANQVQQVNDAGNSGLVYSYVQSLKDKNQFKECIRKLILDKKLRKLISDSGLASVSGDGAYKVIKQMILVSIQVRPASIDDAKNLYDWRNHPLIRSVSRNSHPIDFNSHMNWFRDALKSVEKLILVGELFGNPIGVVRFDFNESQNEAEVSIYLNPEKFSNGFGGELLRKAELFLVKWNTSINKLNAHVIGQNQKSVNLFRSCNYKLLSSTYEKILKE